MEGFVCLGYLSAEKKAIAQKYLEPQTKKSTGVPEASVQIEDVVMDMLIKVGLAESGFGVARMWIQDYCREAGVRNLKKHIEKIYRKCALRLVHAGAKGPKQLMEEQKKENEAGEADEEDAEKPTEASEESTSKKPEETATEQAEPEMPAAEYTGDPIVVTPASLQDLVGVAPFKSDRLYDKMPPGVAMGLAWTAMGGSTLYTEAAVAERSEGKVSNAMQC